MTGSNSTSQLDSQSLPLNQILDVNNMPTVEYSTGRTIDKAAIINDIKTMETAIRQGKRKTHIKSQCPHLTGFSDTMFDSVFALMEGCVKRGIPFDYGRMEYMIDMASGINNGTIDGDSASKAFGHSMYKEYVANKI